jgi:hypothetical protein
VREEVPEEAAVAVEVPEAWIDPALIRKAELTTKEKEQMRKVRDLAEITEKARANSQRDTQERNKTKIHTTTSTTPEHSLSQREFPSRRKLKFLL